MSTSVLKAVFDSETKCKDFYEVWIDSTSMLSDDGGVRVIALSLPGASGGRQSRSVRLFHLDMATHAVGEERTIGDIAEVKPPYPLDRAYGSK